MVVLRGAQAVGLGPHLSHLIYIYKWKITKYMYVMWSSASYTVTEKLLYITKGLMKVISGLIPETWCYFCMKNVISTTRNCHSHIHESTHFILFALFKVHPPLSGPGCIYFCICSLQQINYCDTTRALYIHWSVSLPDWTDKQNIYKCS